ncbi:MAG: hypothetical protein ACK475_09005, partial [Bacteroidota bacterium]
MKEPLQGYDSVIDIVRQAPCVVQCAGRLTSHGLASIKSLAGSSRSVLVSALWTLGSMSIVVIVADDADVDVYTHDLSVLLGSQSVIGIHGAQRHSALAAGGMVHHEQMDALGAMHEGKRYVVVISAPALALRAPAAGEIRRATMTLERGQNVNYDNVIKDLLEGGFERTDHVSKPGQIAVRGGIIDVFPSGWESPLRLEFWGDVIDSIREFEPLSQRSIREHASVTLLGRMYHQDDSARESTSLDHVPTGALY